LEGGQLPRLNRTRNTVGGVLHALPLLLLAAVAPPAVCQPETALALAELNWQRLAHGSAPLRTHQALCRTATERVDEIVRSGGTDQGVAAINRRTRSLYRKGYAAHIWSEAAIIGGGPERVLEQFREVRPRWYHDAVGGDFEEVGAAASTLEARPVYAILLALPRRSVEWRQAEPLRDLEAVQRIMLAAVNRLRAEEGHSPVALDARLNATAQAHAADMLARGFYDHRSPEGTTPRQRALAAGYPPTGSVGENIAKGPFTPSEVVGRWINSSGHRRNILRAGNALMGVGVAFGETADGFEVLWVQLFGGS